MKKLNTCLFAFAFSFLFSFNASAKAEKEISRIPTSTWLKMNVVKMGKDSSQFFKKYYAYSSGESEVATVSHIIAEKKSDTVDQVRNEVVRLYDIENPAEGKNVDGLWLEGVSSKLGKFIRFDLKETKTSYNYSIATIRLSEVWPTYYEVTALQNVLLQNKAKKTASSFFIEKLLGEKSEAQSSSTTSIIQGLMAEWTSSRNAVTGLSLSVTNSGRDLGARLIDATTPVAAGLESTAKSINGLTSKMTSANFFKYGLAAGAGYALGGVLVSAAVDLVPKALQYIWEKVSGQMSKEDFNKLVGKSQEGWEMLPKLAQEVTDLDKEMQRNLLALEFISRENPNSVALRKQEVINELNKLDYKIKSGDRDICADDSSIASKQVALNLKLDELKEVEKILSKSDTPEKICQNFQTQLLKWTHIENSMTVSKNWILQGTSQLFGAIVEKTGDSARPVASLRESKNTCIKRIEDNYLKVATQNIESCSCKKNVAAKCVDACNSYENAVDMKQLCIDMAPEEAQTNSLAQQKQQTDNLKAIGDQLKYVRKQVNNSFCDKDNVSADCASGTDGSFTQIRKKLAADFGNDKMSKLCPSLQLPVGLSNSASEPPQPQVQQKQSRMVASESAAPAAVPASNKPLSEDPGFASIRPETKAAVMVSNEGRNLAADSSNSVPVSSRSNQDSPLKPVFSFFSRIGQGISDFFTKPRPPAQSNFNNENYGN